MAAPLDREKAALYEVVGRAVDGGGRFCETRLRVAVQDLNDNPPALPPTLAFSVRDFDVILRGYDSIVCRLRYRRTWKKGPISSPVCPLLTPTWALQAASSLPSRMRTTM